MEKCEFCLPLGYQQILPIENNEKYNFTSFIAEAHDHCQFSTIDICIKQHERVWIRINYCPICGRKLKDYKNEQRKVTTTETGE